MHEEFTRSRSNNGDIQVLQRQVKQVSIAFAIFAAISILCFVLLAGWSWQQSRTLNREMDDLMFGRFVHYEAENDDYVKPTANAIQFFHDGYSLQFETVEYTPKGLVLSGEIGNPNQYRVAHLNLNFVARPNSYAIRDKWNKSDKNSVEWPKEWDIGSAQTIIGDLAPGHTAKFSVTIPNVKQTPDSIRIAVLFFGEQYIYSPGR